MDKETYVLTEYYQYRLDVAEANRRGIANWHVSYTFTEYYGVSNMTAKALAPIAQDFRVLLNSTDRRGIGR